MFYLSIVICRAITLTRGEDAVFEVLSQARATIAASQPRPDPAQQRQEAQRRARLEREAHEKSINDAMKACDELVRADSLLSERCDGSENILRDAFEDGSSVVCRRCGGLVKRLRWDLHNTKWCPSLPQTAKDDEEDDDNGKMDESA